MKRLNARRNEGMALLLSLFFATLAIVALGALSNRVLNQKTHTDRYTEYTACFLGIEAALADSRLSLEYGDDGMVGYTGNVADLSSVTFSSEGVAPFALSSMPEVEYVALAQDWATDGLDNNEDGAVDDAAEVGFYTVYALARNADVTRRVEVVYAANDVNVWQNAIFAGAGQTGGAMKGNVSIHGSVHILGDHIAEGGEAITVLDFMGASLMHNNYGDGSGAGPALPDYLRDRVPPQNKTTVNGETDQDTLNSVLRVRRGLVSLNSASEIGQPEVAGNGLKDTIDGTFNTDGWTGQRVTPDGDRGDPTEVYSDNGWDQTYDLGDKVPFPELTDDWRWPANIPCPHTGTPGGTEPGPGGQPYVHEDFFNDVLSDGSGYNGNVTIRVGQDYYLNLTRGGTPDTRVQADPANCIEGDDYLYYDGDTNVLEINGQVKIDGNLIFQRSGGKKIINYTGRAAILATGDVTIGTSLLTCNNGDPADHTRSFPENNAMGLMAGRDMFVGDNSQLDLMGAFYAQRNIVCNKQCKVMGTFVAEFFDLSDQVPDIYQVPALAEYLPFGMIANYPILAFTQVSWREMGD